MITRPMLAGKLDSGYKLCSKCKQVKPKTMFNRIGKLNNKLRSWCNNCKNTVRRKQYSKNPEPLKKISRDHGRKLREEVLIAYGSKCSCPSCDITEPQFLAVDHIDGSGYANRFVQGHGRKLYLWLKKHHYPKDNFQLLCHNCNFAKGAYGICPHLK